MPTKRLRFLHIPKTAGSTFTNLLLRLYRGKMYFAFHGEFISDANRYYSLSQTERQEIRLFLGHAPIKTDIEDADNATIVTFLRHPVNRVKSFCQHVSEGKAGYLSKDFPPESFDLDKFLDSGNLELSNMQTKMLINTKSCASPNLLEKMTFSEAKDKALENLFYKVASFGILEHFDKSLIRFSQFFHGKMPFYFIANRKNPKRLIEFKQRHLDRIEELNSLDMEVYKIATEKFVEHIESEEFDSGKLKRLRSLNPPVSKYMQLKAFLKKRYSNQK